MAIGGIGVCLRPDDQAGITHPLAALAMLTTLQGGRASLVCEG